MKKWMILLVMVVGMLATWADTPMVTDVTAKQRYPWNGLVDISCNVSGVDSVGDRYRFVMVAVNKDSGEEYTASHFSVVQDSENDSEYIVFEDGAYKLLWDARTDLGQVVYDKMTVRVTLEAVVVSSGKVQLWEGGPYWADRNIGADNPWESGLYFWWGDTKGHRPSGKTFSFTFSSSNCPTSNKREDQLCSEGWITSNGVLTPSHDAAHVKWGGSWRMPTYQEWTDLNSKCDWAWTTMNSVNGYIVRGRGEYASHSIFLPCAGFGNRTSQGDSGSYLGDSGLYGWYWSSVRGPRAAWYIYFNVYYHLTNYSICYEGFSIRPVKGFSK